MAASLGSILSACPVHFILLLQQQQQHQRQQQQLLHALCQAKRLKSGILECRVFLPFLSAGPFLHHEA